MRELMMDAVVKMAAGAVLALVWGGLVMAQETGTIAGQVIADGTNAPLSHARLFVAGGAREVSTGADGRFTITGVAPGSHTLVILRDGYATLSEVVEVTAGGTVTLDVRLPEAPTLTQEIVVRGRLSDYVETSAGAARTSARLIDVPQAIQVLPARFLEDIGALDTKDLYKHISGVSDSPYSSTVVRGFTQREVLINGARGNPYGSLDGDINGSGFSTSQFRLSNVERVEILKGPASVLYGSSEPGGVINYVTKRPRDQFETRVSLGSGQFSQALGEVEVTGPANAARTLLYRGAVYFEDRDGYRFNTELRNVHAVGSLAWKATPRAALAVDYEHIDQRNAAHRLRGVPVDAAGDFLTDYRWTASEPTDYTDLEAHVWQVRWEQAFSRGARFDSTFRYLRYDRDENYHEPRGFFAGGTMMHRDFRDQVRTNDDWTFAAGLSAPVTTGAVRHDLAVGGDLMRQDHLFRFATVPQQSAGGPVPPLSILSPVYGTTRGAAYAIASSRYRVDTAQTLRGGVYAQDLMSLGPRWNLLIGGRLDQYDDTGDNGGVALSAEHTAVTGRAGLVFKPLAGVSLYSSLSNGFTRASILAQTPDANGPHAPETSRQAEVGAKSEWLDGRVQLTAAFFHTVKENVLRPDPAFGLSGSNFNAVLSTGEVRNRGVEIDLAGQVRPAWNVAFNYAWLDSAITRDLTAALVGRQMPNAAPHAAGLFTRVDLPYGAALGGSVEYLAAREEPFASLVAPAYTVVDAHYFQQITPRVKLLVRAENVFDTRYSAFSLFAARVGNVPGQPRTVSVALTITSRTAGGARP
jgi:iron complex outermembrane recepter protein